MFEHAVAPIIAALEFSRVLRVGGFAWVCIPTATKSHTWVYADEHHFCVPRDNMCALFKKAGFTEYSYSEEKENANGGDEQFMQIFFFVKAREVLI